MHSYASDLSITVDGITLPLLKANADPLTRAVIMSLFTWRRAEPDDSVPESHSRQGWFGDTYASVTGDKIGSRLWLLAREKLTPATIERARSYAEEALHWLLEDAVASHITVQAERVGLSMLAVRVAIYRTDGPPRQLDFEDVWSVLNAEDRI